MSTSQYYVNPDVNAEEEEKRLASLLAGINAQNKKFTDEIKRLGEEAEQRNEEERAKEEAEYIERQNKLRFEREQARKEQEAAEEAERQAATEKAKKRNPFYQTIKKLEQGEDEKTDYIKMAAATTVERTGELIQMADEAIYLKSRALLNKITAPFRKDSVEEDADDEEILQRRYEKKEEQRIARLEIKQQKQAKARIERQKKMLAQKEEEERMEQDAELQITENTPEESTPEKPKKKKVSKKKAMQETPTQNPVAEDSDEESVEEPVDEAADTDTTKEISSNKKMYRGRPVIIEREREEQRRAEAAEKKKSEESDDDDDYYPAEDMSDDEYNAGLDAKTRSMKYSLQEEHQAPYLEDVEHMINEIQRREDIIAVVLVTSDINNLFVFQDKNIFLQYVEFAEYELDYSYVYIVTETATMYYGNDQCYQEFTDLFDNIRKLLLSRRFIESKHLLKIPGINIFKNIYC